MNYYNEFDPKAAAWLRELIKQGLIPAGDVDERSITEVKPDDIKHYTQCHFFAGIGGWPLALKLAGWPATRPVWTASCPCQPFSSAGAQKGTKDERHLWPVAHGLIRECLPPAVFGEQVAAAIAHGWLDAVFDDLEAAGYACGASDLPACCVGAPQIRQRIFFGAARVADTDNQGPQGRRQSECQCAGERTAGSGGLAGGLGDSASERRGEAGRAGTRPEKRTSDAGAGIGVADAILPRQVATWTGLQGARRPEVGSSINRNADRPGPLDGFWRAADWLHCRDGKWRPVEPGTFPLAHGISERVGLLRGYGNAIVPEAASAFIQAFDDCITPTPTLTPAD